MLSEERGREFATAIVKKIKKTNKTFSFDVNFRMDLFDDLQQAIKAYKPYIDEADILKFSDDEILAYTGKQVLNAAISKVNKKDRLLITLGSKGSMYVYNGLSGVVATEKVTRVDTTGAGDAFFGTVLAEHVRKYCPNAKIFIHETWGYEDGSERLKNMGYQSEEQMYADIERTYKKASAQIKANGIIPCGKAMIYATKFGVEKMHRDTFHADLGVGRYLLALTWYKTLTGTDISGNDFDEFDIPVSQKEREIAVKAVNAAFEENAYKTI